MNITDKFISEIEKIAEKEIPIHVYKRAEESLLDYIAVTTAGAKAHNKNLKKYIEFSDIPAGEYCAIGMDIKTSIKEAVYLNGLNGHALDFDDGTNTGIIHLGSPIFSVLLPLAQKYDISIKKLLKSAIIGYETSFTMAVSIQPTHKKMGYHATGTCGILGIAMAVSYMLDFSKEERRTAFSIASVSATGILKVLDDVSNLKPYNVAKSALLGLIAVQMAKANFTPNVDALGGRGFLQMMAGDENIALKLPLFNGTYAIEKTYTKPYAACRYCHPAIEAAISYNGILNQEEISHILVETYDLAVKGHEHTNIQGVGSAKMSIPYGVCMGILYGKAGFKEYTEEAVLDKTYCNLIEKIEVKANKVYSDNFPKLQSAMITINTKDGSQYTKQVDFPKGEPENPLSNEEFLSRYISLMEYAGKNEEIAITINNLCRDGETKIKELCKLL